MRVVGEVWHQAIDQEEKKHERPLGEDDQRKRNSRQGGDSQAPQCDGQNKDRNHHGEGEHRCPEGQCAHPIQNGLNGHHGEARKSRDHEQSPQTRDPGISRTRRCIIGARDIFAVGERKLPSRQNQEDRRRHQVQATHGVRNTIETQSRDQEETAHQGAREGTQRVEAIDPGVDAGGGLETA